MLSDVHAETLTGNYSNTPWIRNISCIVLKVGATMSEGNFEYKFWMCIQILKSQEVDEKSILTIIEAVVQFCPIFFKY